MTEQLKGQLNQMDDSVFEGKIAFLMKDCNIDRGMATAALIHSKGSMSIAKDFLSNETCKRIFGREAREFNLSN